MLIIKPNVLVNKHDLYDSDSWNSLGQWVVSEKKMWILQG